MHPVGRGSCIDNIICLLDLSENATLLDLVEELLGWRGVVLLVVKLGGMCFAVEAELPYIYFLFLSAVDFGFGSLKSNLG